MKVEMCGIHEDVEAAGLIRLMMPGDNKLYRCQGCLDEMERNMKDMWEKSYAKMVSECKEKGITVVDNCKTCGEKINDSANARYFLSRTYRQVNLCDKCSKLAYEQKLDAKYGQQ